MKKRILTTLLCIFVFCFCIAQDKIDFTFYGTNLSARINRSNIPQLEDLDSVRVESAMSRLMKADMSATIEDLKKLKADLHLNDWGYLKLLEAFSFSAAKTSDAATMLWGYLYGKSGYGMRLMKIEGKLYLATLIQEDIRDYPFVRMDKIPYYIIKKDLGTVKVTALSDYIPDYERAMSLELFEPPTLSKNMTDPIQIGSLQYPDWNFQFCLNGNLIKFYNDYPRFSYGDGTEDDFMTRWTMRAEMPFSDDIKSQLYPKLKKLIEGLSQKAATERILEWIQTGFKYASGQKYWEDKTDYFPEETMSSSKNISKDRAVLMARLVKDLLDLQVVLLYFDEHLSCAVHFTDGSAEGYSVDYEGKRYVICETMNINGKVGEPLAKFRNEKPENIAPVRTAKQLLAQKIMQNSPLESLPPQMILKKAKHYYQTQNYKLALKAFQLIPDNAEAQFKLGVIYADGLSVSTDLVSALYWLTKAGEQNHIEAQNKLGNLYMSNNSGIVQDYTKAIEWYTKAANNGWAAAQNDLGYMYGTGKGVNRDYAKALEWYLKAANQGSATAQKNLGIMYYNGDGMDKNYKEAERWFNEAIDSKVSDVASCYRLLALISAQQYKTYTVAYNYLQAALENTDKEDQEALLKIKATLGQIQVWEGDMEGAKETLNGCLDLDPNFWSSGYEFAEMMSEYKDKGVDVDTEIAENKVSTNNNTFVVIIGNEKYKNVADVPFAANDARVFRDYMEKTLGIPEGQIHYVENAGYNDLRLAMKWMIQAMKLCGGKGKGIFYYAGHGIPNEKDMSAYLLPIDGIGSDAGSAFSLKELMSHLSAIESESITVFLDACFSGSNRDGGMLASARAVALEVKQTAPKGNVVVFSAAQGSETAYPYTDMRHGMFTYYLLKKLKETQGDITLGDLSDYLTTEVSRQSFVKNGKTQTPTVTPSLNIQSQWRDMKLK